MSRIEKNSALLFTLLTILCVGAAHLSQWVYKAEAGLFCLAAFCLFYDHLSDPLIETPKTLGSIYLALILLCGTGIRLMIAVTSYGNYDIHSWEIAGDIASRGGNIYAESERYTTSPLWFWVIGGLRSIHSYCPTLTFGAVIRIFLTIVDLATAGLLILISREEKAPASNAALLFYLNPVSFLLTGYHGQFENIAIFFLVLGLYGHKFAERRSKDAAIWLWLFSTVGMVFKHNIFYELIIGLRTTVKKFWVGVFLFILSCVIFLISFTPYWSKGSQDIIHHVFLYSSYPLNYGISTFLRAGWIKFVFIGLLFLYPLCLPKKDLIRNLLLGTLFFLVFTTGFGNQYLILPVALAALRPSKSFLLFSLAATLYLLGDNTNLHLKFLSWVPANLVWAASCYWLIHSQTAKPPGPAGRGVHAIKESPGQ